METTFREPYYSFYGSQKMLKSYCPDCLSYAFVIDGVHTCCDAKFIKPKKALICKRESDCEIIRKRPSASHNAAAPNNCGYCDREYGTLVEVWSKSRKKYVAKTLYSVGDQMVCFAYSLDNRDSNFMNCCQVCNGWKSGKMFDSIEDIRQYLLEKWRLNEKKENIED